MPVLVEARTSSWSPKFPSISELSATPFAPVNFVALQPYRGRRRRQTARYDPCGKPIPPVGPGGGSNSIAFTARDAPEGNSRYRARRRTAWCSRTPFHRILGTRFGVTATDLVANGQFGRMVCLKAGKMASVSLDEALEKMKSIDPSSQIVNAARSVGITFGDSA
jgi:hypothetical protein